MIGEFIGEVIVHAFFDVFLNQIVTPSFKIIGVMIRWSFSFGKMPFKVINEKDYNTRLGVIVLLILTLILMFVFY